MVYIKLLLLPFIGLHMEIGQYTSVRTEYTGASNSYVILISQETHSSQIDKLKEVQKSPRSPSHQNIFSHFTVVFRYVFLEEFPTSETLTCSFMAI